MQNTGYCSTIETSIATILSINYGNMNITVLSGRLNELKNDYMSWDFRMWSLAVLTAFSYERMYRRFAGEKITRRRYQRDDQKDSIAITIKIK